MKSAIEDANAHRLSTIWLDPKLCWLCAVLILLLTACATPQISNREISQSDPRARDLVAASREAHGGQAFNGVHDVSVRYEGRWALIGPRFQPVLSDRKFRGNSEERLLVPPGIMAQEHSGPAGKKVVLRQPGTVSVTYNGLRSEDAEVKAAAALVADAYTLFLLGPFYFDRPGVVFSLAGGGYVDKAACDQVLAVVRPGFGMSEEDRVLLSIDRATRQLRRVRMTLNGLESTRAAEVDITFRDFRTIGGIQWPTDIDERIRVPFRLHAHHWKLRGLSINRGFGASDLTAVGFKGRAAIPAEPLDAQDN